MIPLFFHQRFHYKGGSSSAAQQIQSAPVPLPAPPVTPNNPASLQAEHDFALAQQAKNSIRKTILAGDTGGYTPKATAQAAAAGPTTPKPAQF